MPWLKRPGESAMPEGPASTLIERLEWKLRRASASSVAGDYRSLFRGRGVEFDQVVKYQWGDDQRDIDWNVTARLGEPYRKRFIEQRDICVLLVFEDAPELQSGSAGRTRRETLVEAATLLLLIGLMQRDRVGLLYTSPTQSWLRRPAGTRETVLRTAAMLLEEDPPALDSVGTATTPWPLVLCAAPRHSVLVWLGPFAPGAEPAEWPALVRRYQVVGFRADDPWDHALPPKGRLPIFDPVGRGSAQFDFSSPANRAAHAAWAEAREAHFSALFPDERTRHALPTEKPVFDSVAEFFHRQAHAGAGGR